MKNAKVKTKNFDIAEYLDNEEVIQAYLAEVLKEGDQAEFMRALGHIARARSMNELAQKTGLGRESLYKTLSGNSKPKFDTILKILHALNIDLVPTIAKKQSANAII